MTADVRGRYAGMASRVTANMIDVAVVAVSCIGGVWFAEAAWALVQLEPLGEVQLSPTVTALIVPTVVYIYFVGGWALFGKTVGKAVLGLRVVRPDGRRVHVARAFVRLTLSLTAIVFLFIGYAWVLVDHRRRAVHDIIAGTVVVYDWDDEVLPHELTPVAPHP